MTMRESLIRVLEQQFDSTLFKTEQSMVEPEPVATI